MAAGALGFGGGFAQGLMQALAERRQRRREDEQRSEQQQWRELQLTLPILVENAQVTNDWSGVEAAFERASPDFGKQSKKQGGSPFEKLKVLLGGGGGIQMPEDKYPGRTPPYVPEEDGVRYGEAAKREREMGRRGPMVPTTQQEQQLPGAPTKIELPQRQTFMGVEMASPEERNRRLVQKTLDELTAGVTARRTLAQQQGLSESDQKVFALTGDIPSVRTATPAQPGSSAEYVGLKVQEALGRGETPTPEQRMAWRAEFDKNTEQSATRQTEFGQYYQDWLKDKGKTEETSTSADRLAARREFLGAGQRQAMTPGQMATTTRALRNDFVRETRASKEAMRQVDVMQKGLAAAKAGDRIGGDQAIISTFNRMTEPNSVTMVSEYARTPQGVALVDRIREAVNRVTAGGSGVPIENLEQLVSLAEQFAEEQAAMGNDVSAEISALATEFGIKPELVTREFAVPQRDGTKKPTAGSPSKPVSKTAAPSTPQGLTMDAQGNILINGKPLPK